MTMKRMAESANALMAATSALEAAIEVDDFTDLADHMRYCADTLRPLMREVRQHADALEVDVADNDWPLPKYREMLFIR
jgi:glutamine synthetase